ncbi:MAG: NADH-quinone oxidoreductase subunit L [Deltaproteobacteria bacterium]|nr:NADH-quinone oxidoreductase subunit L [Deltaproteobacteria bacterium]
MRPEFISLIPLLPLGGALINILFGGRLSRRVSTGLAVVSVALAAFMVVAFWSYAAGGGTRVELYTWIEASGLRVPLVLLFDSLSASMALMVTGVSTLIHIYCLGYMSREKDYVRFFVLLNLFVFAMLVIVLAGDLLVLFLGWEGVGFCSYALIGFWYREGRNADAGQKAFVMTRAADVFLLIAMLWLFRIFGTFSIPDIMARTELIPAAAATPLVLLLLAGACGKSAQFPFMSWLPDAMAGPTPVSALIHAATMVTAGVYLLCRLFPLVMLSAQGMAAIALVGILTAGYAALCALAQDEIKRVLAYSTMSQVGYMFVALGAGTLSGAMFHLYTHAFFKSLLFLGAGCIVLLGGENNIFRMDRAARRNPLVFGTFLVGSLALAGAPLTSGFFSKDGILTTVFSRGSGLYELVWVLGSLTAFVTALYTFRLLYLVFGGKEKTRGEIPTLSFSMAVVLPFLAVAALFGGVINLPAIFGGNETLRHFLEGPDVIQGFVAHREEIILTALAVAVFAIGWLAAYGLFRRESALRDNMASRFFRSGFYIDQLLETLFQRPFRTLARFWDRATERQLFDGFFSGLGNMTFGGAKIVRRMQTGRLSTYLGSFAWGLLFLASFFLCCALGG